MGFRAKLRSVKKLSVSESQPTYTAIMLYLVGLGLADERDITAKGLEIVKSAERVYLEAYTAVLLVDVQRLVRAEEGHMQSQRLSARVSK